MLHEKLVYFILLLLQAFFFLCLLLACFQPKVQCSWRCYPIKLLKMQYFTWFCMFEKPLLSIIICFNFVVFHKWLSTSWSHVLLAEFVQVFSPSHVKMRVWERGAGLCFQLLYKHGITSSKCWSFDLIAKLY